MGLPTLRDLFRAIMNGPERVGTHDKTEVLNALGMLYPHFEPRMTPPSFPPFEQFLSLVDSAKEFPFYGDDYWSQKERSALRLLTDSLAEATKAAENSDLLARFTERLEYGDVVITFNWDGLIERSLFRQTRRINLVERDPSAVTLLKLHGSLNWFRLPEGPTRQDPKSVARVHPGSDIFRTVDFAYYDMWGILNEPPFIIPPTVAKRPLGADLLERIWWEAFNALIEAGRVTVIGYSLPVEDLHARTFLRSGLVHGRKRYMVIDPNPEVGGRYFTQVGDRIEFVQSFFDHAIMDIIFQTSDQ